MNRNTQTTRTPITVNVTVDGTRYTAPLLSGTPRYPVPALTPALAPTTTGRTT